MTEIPEGVPTRKYADEPLHESDRPIPEKVTREELLEAMAPLYRLFNVTPYEVYAPIVVANDEVTFTVVAPEASIPSTTRYGETRELGVGINIKVIG